MFANLQVCGKGHISTHGWQLGEPCFLHSMGMLCIAKQLHQPHQHAKGVPRSALVVVQSAEATSVRTDVSSVGCE